MPSQEQWILRAARLFPSPTPNHIRTSDVPLVLICLDISDDDLAIRRALGVGRVREIPVANLVRVLTPILPAENSASERYSMFKVFDEYGSGTVGLHDLERVAVPSGLLTQEECGRIMSTLANTSHGITFDQWCRMLVDETQEPLDDTNPHESGFLVNSSFSALASSTKASLPGKMNLQMAESGQWEDPKADFKLHEENESAAAAAAAAGGGGGAAPADGGSRGTSPNEGAVTASPSMAHNDDGGAPAQ